ncbi:hypothetical protein OIU79_009815 [Salix purpurea]|uniref:Uncharacterized protein n=1 Tax=Salix purpurea TaxID=77065 RepID=A0A9Q0QEH5_SALPP|nr:hypothetical protein OIU79_009815 [Salix purpurea]
MSSPCQLQTISFRAGLTSSSQNLVYSKVSPEHLDNSTTTSSEATSNTSAVTASFPFRPSSFPCNFTLNSASLTATLKFNLFATDFNVVRIVDAGHFEVNIEFLLLLVSNKLDKSNPDDIEDMSSKALKKGGECFDPVLPGNSSGSSLPAPFPSSPGSLGDALD